jgi:hypothetical protein
MSKGPVIGLCRTLDDLIRAMANIRAFFQTWTTANVDDSKDRRYVTDAQLASLQGTVKVGSTSSATTLVSGTTVSISGPFPDAGGSAKKAVIACRFISTNPDGSDNWQFEVTTAP